VTRSDWLPITILGGLIVVGDLVVVALELTSSGPSAPASESASPASSSPRSSLDTPKNRDALRAARPDSTAAAPLRPSRAAPTALNPALNGASRRAAPEPEQPITHDTDTAAAAFAKPDTRPRVGPTSGTLPTHDQTAK